MFAGSRLQLPHRQAGGPGRPGAPPGPPGVHRPGADGIRGPASPTCSATPLGNWVSGSSRSSSDSPSVAAGTTTLRWRAWGRRARGRRTSGIAPVGVVPIPWEWRKWMSLTLLRLPRAWKWGGLSFKELAVRTYEAVDRHETMDRAAIVAFYALLALVPFLGLVLTIALGASDSVVAGQILSLSRQFLPEAADDLVRGELRAIRAAPR